MAVISVAGFKCERCGHEWAPRLGRPPKVCPECKRTDWNTSGEEGASTEAV